MTILNSIIGNAWPLSGAATVGPTGLAAWTVCGWIAAREMEE